MSGTDDPKQQGLAVRPYEVGFGKPPSHSRFKPGQSGNPKGRPKGARNVRSITQEALGQTIRISEGSRSRVITKAEAILMAMVNKAIRGDVRAAGLMVKLMEADSPGSNTVPATGLTWAETLKALSDEQLDTMLRELGEQLSAAGCPETASMMPSAQEARANGQPTGRSSRSDD